jgi:endo-1,4-beta-xylanase
MKTPTIPPKFLPIIALATLTLSGCSRAISSPAKPFPMDATEERIRQIRTGEVHLTVVDATKQPIANADIQLLQTRHYFQFGTSLNTEMLSTRGDVNTTDRNKYRKIANRLFNAAVHENAMKWHEMEPKPGKVNFADVDQLFDWAKRHKMPMRGHTIFWEEPKYMQDWLKKTPKEELKPLLFKRVEDVCGRYKGRINEFDLFNEALDGDFFGKQLGNSIYIEMFTHCQQVNPQARLYTNEFFILDGDRTEQYAKQIETWQKQGAKIGGIGIQAHLETSDKPTFESIHQSLDRLAEFQLPIKITEVSIQAETEAAQAEKLREFMRAIYAHPAVTSMIFWGFWDGNLWMKDAGLYRADWSEKPAGEMYRQLVFEQWWTRERLQTDEAGKANTRAFYGKYEAIVEQGDRRKVVTFAITPTDKDGKTITVKLD